MIYDGPPAVRPHQAYSVPYADMRCAACDLARSRYVSLTATGGRVSPVLAGMVVMSSGFVAIDLGSSNFRAYRVGASG